MTFEWPEFIYSRDDIRNSVLSALDPSAAAVTMSIDGTIDLEDLWWFYEEHRILVDGSAWLLAMMSAGQLTEEERTRIGHFNFWHWYDHGRRAL